MYKFTYLGLGSHTIQITSLLSADASGWNVYHFFMCYILKVIKINISILYEGKIEVPFPRVSAVSVSPWPNDQLHKGKITLFF